MLAGRPLPGPSAGWLHARVCQQCCPKASGVEAAGPAVVARTLSSKQQIICKKSIFGIDGASLTSNSQRSIIMFNFPVLIFLLL